jgi:lysozyme
VMFGLLGSATAFGWFVWLPHYRPGLSSGERYGIDVSHHQGEIDWARVALDDIGFAYIKATEGGDLVDSRFGQNWSEAARAGLERGAYHFFTLCTPGEAQAKNFLAAIVDDPGELPPAIDLELARNCGRRPDEPAVERELLAFLRLVEEGSGRSVLVYVGDDFEQRYPVRARLERPTWLRRFLRRPSAEHWLVWQVQGFSEVDGISGRVDLDIMRPQS